MRSAELRVLVLTRPVAGDPGWAARLSDVLGAMDDGIEVWLDPEHTVLPAGLPVTVRVHPLHRVDDRELFFCAEQRAALSVLRTLVDHPRSGDALRMRFVGCTDAALDVVRARRLLGWFPDVSVDLDDEHGASADGGPDAVGQGHADVGAVFRRWAAGYVRRNADTTLVAERPGDSGDVSVVIPLFNQGAWVEEAIDSVRSDAPGAQVVVVNDGSTDAATNSVFYRLRDVVRIRQTNRGLAAARNAGIAASTGRYVVPLDADDTLEPGFLSSAVAALDADPELGYLVGHSRYTGLLDHVYVPMGFIPELNLFLHTHGKATACYRRSALDAVGGYDTAFRAFEDWELQVSLFRAGFGTDVMPIPVHRYRRHDRSMSFTTSNAIRHTLVDQILEKHVGMLDTFELRTAVRVLAQLWKTGYEPSTSVLLQQRRGTG